MNFAAPADAVATLLYTANLAPAHSADDTARTLRNSTHWTSMTSGADYSIRVDGDYVYVDRTNIPDKAKMEGVFQRGELKRTGEHWIGKVVFHFGCRCKRKPKWCTVDADIDITNMSASRIEGKMLTWDWGKFNGCKDEAEGAKTNSFVWIPKD